MIINFFLKEVAEENPDDRQDEITITLIKRGRKGRSQSVNTKHLDDLTAVEQQTIRAAMAIVEKYRAKSEGAEDMKYGL